MEIKLIDISSLVTEGLQTRDGLAKSVVKDYAEMMKSGCTLPPVEVVRDSATGQLYLVDGYHRVDAAKRLKRTVIDAQVTDGTYTDAIRCAIKANAAHGLRRSNADKRNALKMAWEHRQALFGGEPSHEVLAAACAVSKRTAQRFRETASGMDNVHPCARVGADGKCYQSPTTNHQSLSTVTDRFGVAVPEDLVEAFTSKDLIRTIQALRKSRDYIAEQQKDGNLAFIRVAQSALITLQNAADELNACKPHCICRVCGGRGCRACGNLGVQTKLEYDRNPSEIKGEEI